ncbi:hypothetical protein FQR65_LT19160 [Abscondita terminalis]|nr:hypothetical protein FQR65_LT19160 [Abscondita terminalis]
MRRDPYAIPNNGERTEKMYSINKGYDPRDFSLVVIGGGGPMHGAYLAEELQIPEASDSLTLILSILINPDEGAIRSNSTLNKVVFPAPLFPTSPNVSPLGILSS